MSVFGVDSHKRSLAVSAVDQVGRELARGEFANTPDGHRRLMAWTLEQGSLGRIGIEGSGGLGRALAQQLLAEGFEVVDVPGTLTDRERKRLARKGKSDPQDALAIARVTLREPTLEPLTPDGSARELKLLCDYREQLCSERTRVQNRLHADLVVLAPGYERNCPNLVAKRHLETATRVLRNLSGVQAEIARKRLHTLRRLDGETKALENRIETLVRQTATGLTTLVGIGPLGAARILGEVRDIHRYANKDRFASANGTAPIAASSGATHRHRLNRGGNRRLNRVIHTMALTQIRCDPRARAYIDRRRHEGKTYRDATRSLKRHLSDVIYQQLRNDTTHRPNDPT